MSEDGIEARVTRLENLTDILRENYREEKQARQDLEEKLLDERRDKRQLEQRIAELESALDDQVEIMRKAMRSSSLKPVERASLLIQALWSEAKRNGEKSGQKPRATMTAGEAVKALHGDVDRTLMYGESGTFQKAEDLVGDTDILEYRTEDRASAKNTRLIMNLEAGEPPQTAEGYDLVPQEAD